MVQRKPVYNRIKAVLAEQGKANLWLAETIGKNKATVSKWCTNETQPSLETLFQIAEALNVEVRELIASRKVK